MDLNHQFHVPTSVEQTWDHFQDIAGLAGCFPGAQVTSVEGDSFTGTCKVKLGPIALVYTGTGTFLEKDESAHRFVVDAKGKDKRGNGTAAAKATLSMAPAPSGGTDVQVVTELAITGKPAQFGRGLMQEVSDKLLGQFVACLEQQLAPHPEPELAVAQAATAAPATSPDGAAGTAPEVPVAVPSRAPASRATPAAQPEALDLGATVLPVLLKSYWKQGALGLLVIAVIIRLIRR